MQSILVLDEKNYDPALPELRRVAVRGIIFIEGKLLLVGSNSEEVEFPGGGQEENETDLDTLVREIAEETGYRVLPGSVRPLGQVEEKRLSFHEPMIWHQINRYYFCDVEPYSGQCRYSENEKADGSHPVMCSLDEAIRLNEEGQQREGMQTWGQREMAVLKLLQKQLAEEEKVL